MAMPGNGKIITLKTSETEILYFVETIFLPSKVILEYSSHGDRLLDTLRILPWACINHSSCHTDKNGADLLVTKKSVQLPRLTSSHFSRAWGKRTYFSLENKSHGSDFAQPVGPSGSAQPDLRGPALTLLHRIHREEKEHSPTGESSSNTKGEVWCSERNLQHSIFYKQQVSCERIKKTQTCPGSLPLHSLDTYFSRCLKISVYAMPIGVPFKGGGKDMF